MVRPVASEAGAPRRARVRALAGPALIALLCCACGSAGSGESDLALELEVAPSPPRVGVAHLTLTLEDAGGDPVEDAGVHIEGNMNHAGMVPVFADAKEVTPGRYEAELELTMGGDWVLLVDAKTPDGRKHHWQEDLPGVRPD